ncbi:hypothetical protein HAALTHF_06970n [Vreelandella aquamarina]|nr:hypothetical protein HAALTHF_06970n [Halomonas axialensis]
MWVVSEWLRTWMLTGFPWLLLGTSQIDSPLAPWAPVGGVYLLSLMTALTGTLGVEVLRRRWSFPCPNGRLVDRSIPIARPMDNPGWQAHPGGIAARES